MANYIIEDRPKYNRVTPLFRLTQVIWYALWIVETILLLRLALRLLAANPAAGFTDFVYRLSAPLVSPFLNVLKVSSVQNAGVMEWGTLFAILIYYLLARAIVGLMLMGRPIHPTEANAKLRQQEMED